MRKIVIFAAMMVALAACSNQQGEKKADDGREMTKSEVMTIDEFFEKGEELNGKTVSVKGQVDHVCKHGGKRMFLVGSKPEYRLKITTGEDIPSFDVAYEGSKMHVTGTVEVMKMDSAYLANWEKELREGAAEEHKGHEHGDGEGDGTGEGEDHEHDHTSHGEQADMGEHIPGMEKVEGYRAELKETGKAYIPIFSVVADKVAETK